MKQVSVFLENKPNQLSNILKMFAENGIDLYALNISETADFGVMRIIVDDPKFCQKLAQENHYICALNDVFVVGVPNELGGLNGLIELISNAGLNVEYMYSMVDSGSDNIAYMTISVDDDKLMNNVLSKNNIKFK